LPAAHGRFFARSAPPVRLDYQIGLLAAERHAALRQALAQLPPCCQQLLTLLTEDPAILTPRSAPSWASR